VYIYDIDDAAGPAGPNATADFRLLVWQYKTPKDSVRLYTHQDHYFGGPITDAFTAAEVLEYSVWGCNSSAAGGCQVKSNWTMLAATADPELDAMIAFNRVDVPPIPEPATWLLLTGGIGVLALRRRASGI